MKTARAKYITGKHEGLCISVKVGQDKKVGDIIYTKKGNLLIIDID